MSSNIDEFEGFEELEKMLSDISKNVSEDKVLNVLEEGANEFAEIMRNLPKPRSQINKSGYTHMLDSITTEVTKKQVAVGWGKYYGRMVEDGTHRMSAQPHMNPAWEHSKENIYKHMIKKIIK